MNDNHDVWSGSASEVIVFESPEDALDILREQSTPPMTAADRFRLEIQAAMLRVYAEASSDVVPHTIEIAERNQVLRAISNLLQLQGGDRRVGNVFGGDTPRLAM